MITSEIIWQDTQHNDLYDIFSQLKQKPEKRLLDRLRETMHGHFRVEEAYMYKLDFPQVEAHSKAHRDIEDKITQLINETILFDSSFAHEIADLMTHWLNNHIKTHDRLLESFVLQSEYK